MKRFPSPVCLFLTSVCVCSLLPIPVGGQSNNVDERRVDRDKLLETYKKLQQTPTASDAALDASVVIGLLQSQPALALQIKKVLIKDALDQGRLLEEKDLT